MSYEKSLYGDQGNIIKAFRECAEEYGIHFTVEQYRHFTKNNPYAPLVHEIFAKTRFNKIKRFLFGEESLNRKRYAIEEIKRNYKEVCDRHNRPLNIAEYGRKKDDSMISPRLIRKKTTSQTLKLWYKQKKKDEILGTNKADSIKIKRNHGFEEFCEECAQQLNECQYNKNTCPYWQDNILGE